MTSISDDVAELLRTNRLSAKISRDQYQLTEYRLVRLARLHGVSWAIIGGALNTTAGSARVTHVTRKAAGMGGES